MRALSSWRMDSIRRGRATDAKMADRAETDFGFLKSSPLFEGLGEREIDRLIEIAQVRRFEAGTVIVEQGTEGDAIYLLCEGSVAVGAPDRSGVEIELATLAERGDFFGEVGVIEPGLRSATVRAETNAVLLEITVERLVRFFDELKEAEAVVLRNIARVLARRLRDSNMVLGTH